MKKCREPGNSRFGSKVRTGNRVLFECGVEFTFGMAIEIVLKAYEFPSGDGASDGGLRESKLDGICEPKEGSGCEFIER
jgi:hypothetical protein